MKKIVLLSACLFLALTSQCQVDKYANYEAVLTDVYDVISGPKGERDWSRFHNLFHEKALMGSTIKDTTNQYRFVHFTPQGYQTNNHPFFMQNNFYEEELSRSTNVIGGLAFISSSYQFKFEEDGPVIQKGVNHIQMINEKGRWWITSLIWEAEVN